MIKQVPHPVTGAGAADLGLALGVAYALHAPAGRAPEVASRTTKTHRTPARGRRRTTARG